MKNLETKVKSAKTFSADEQGFSIIEMVVALTVFVIVIGAIFGMLSLGRIDRNRSSRRSDVMKNARAAIHLMGRDILNAGFQFHQRGAIVPDNFVGNVLGIPVDTDTDNDFLPAIVAGNNVRPSSLQSTTNTDLISICYRDLNFNVPATPTAPGEGDPINIKNSSNEAALPSDVTTLTTKNGEANQVNVYDLLLLETASSQILFMPTSTADGNKIRVAPGDPFGLNIKYNGNSTNSTVLRKCTATRTDNCVPSYAGATAKKIRWISYSLTPEGTLIRTIYGNNQGGLADEQVQRQPIAYNIQDMQFKYVLKDGTVTDNPVAGPDGDAGTDDDIPENLNLIRQVTVTIIVQATERDEQTKRFETITMSSTFSTRNLQYDAG